MSGYSIVAFQNGELAVVECELRLACLKLALEQHRSFVAPVDRLGRISIGEVLKLADRFGAYVRSDVTNSDVTNSDVTSSAEPTIERAGPGVMFGPAGGSPAA